MAKRKVCALVKVAMRGPARYALLTCDGDLILVHTADQVRERTPMVTVSYSKAEVDMVAALIDAVGIDTPTITDDTAPAVQRFVDAKAGGIEAPAKPVTPTPDHRHHGDAERQHRCGQGPQERQGGLMDPAMRQFLIDTGKTALDRCRRGRGRVHPHARGRATGGKFEIMVLLGAHPYTMMQSILPTLREMQPVSMGLTVDSYIITKPLDGEADLLERRARYGNSLQAMFEAGEPDVFECLVVHIVSATGTEVIHMPYVRTDDGGVAWRESTMPDDAVAGGRLIDALRAVWDD